jgi:putative SOS response-associated peptidase YedK
MCGRFVRYSSIQELIKEFGVEGPSFDLKSSYNIAPSQEIAIVINDRKKRLALCKWGFIPSWSKDPKIGYKMINARAESVAEKPSFKGAFKSRRILIAADGFYEWQKKGKTKIPVYIRLKSGKPFGFAGLFNICTSPDGTQICTCTIITTEANSLLEPVHNRMPVIIGKGDHDKWLNPENDGKKLKALLKPFSSEDMDYYGVSTLVNSPSHNSPDCIKPS